MADTADAPASPLPRTDLPDTPHPGDNPRPGRRWRDRLTRIDNAGVPAIFGARGLSHSPRFVLGTWLVSRVLILVMWVGLHYGISDTGYYYLKMSLLSQSGAAQTMIEYPTPVLWYFRTLYAVSLHREWAFVTLFVLTMMGLDAGFTRALWRRGAERRGEAVLFWSVFLVLMGPTAYLRFDLVTAVLAAMALMSLQRGAPARAGVLTGIGAAIKLWPALLWPTLLGGDRRARIRATLGFALTGGVLVVGSLWYAGWGRLMSPLTYQSQRGLQIESLWAVPPMLWRLVHRSAYAVNLSIWNSFEISGPMTEHLITAAKYAQYLGIVFVALTYVRWLRRGRERLIEAAALMLTVILMMILTNKAFSPQYMMWLGGPAAAAIAVLPHSRRPDDTGIERQRSEDESVRRLRVITRVLLVCTLLTTLVYPLGYDQLVRGMVGVTVVTLALVARNLLLAWLFVLLALWAWHFAWRNQRREGDAADPDSPRSTSKETA